MTMDIVLTPINEELLYRVESYTDGIAGQLQVRIPVNFDGHHCLHRPETYIGHTQVQTTRGPLTVQFEIEANSLREAFQKWPELAKHAIAKCVQDIQSNQLRQSILAPAGKRS